MSTCSGVAATAARSKKVVGGGGEAASKEVSQHLSHIFPHIYIIYTYLRRWPNGSATSATCTAPSPPPPSTTARPCPTSTTSCRSAVNISAKSLHIDTMTPGVARGPGGDAEGDLPALGRALSRPLHPRGPRLWPPGHSQIQVKILITRKMLQTTFNVWP